LCVVPHAPLFASPRISVFLQFRALLFPNDPNLEATLSCVNWPSSSVRPSALPDSLSDSSLDIGFFETLISLRRTLLRDILFSCPCRPLLSVPHRPSLSFPVSSAPPFRRCVFFTGHIHFLLAQLFFVAGGVILTLLQHYSSPLLPVFSL